MKTNERRESNSAFASLTGIICLAALCIICAYFHLMNLTVFLMAVLLIGLFSFIWGKLSLRGVNVDAQAFSCNVFPGEEIQASIEVSNTKIIPVIWINVRYFDTLPRFLADDSEIEHRVSWLMPRQKAAWTTSIKTKCRGIAFMDSIHVDSGDGFGLCTESFDFPVSKPLMIVVYPKVFAVDAGVLIQSNTSMLPSDRGCIDDNTLFKGIHDYQSGDSIKHINWRVLARQGELTVNEYQSVIPRHVTFVLDMMSFTKWREETTNSGTMMVLARFDADSLEDMISLAASCILALTERKIQCTLVLPAFGDHAMKVIDGNGLADQIPLLLTELAGLEYNGEECNFRGLGRRAYSFGQTWLLSETEELSNSLKKEFPDARDAGQIIHSNGESESARRIIELKMLRRDNGQDN